MARSALLILAALGPAAGQEDLPALLEAHCVDCHGGARPKAGLDLRVFDGADLERAAVLAARVRAREMPPPDLGRPTLRRLNRPAADVRRSSVLSLVHEHPVPVEQAHPFAGLEVALVRPDHVPALAAGG